MQQHKIMTSFTSSSPDDVTKCFEYYCMPSYWSTKHKSRDDVITHFVTKMTENSKLVVEQTKSRCELDATYGEGDRAKIDFYYPKGSNLSDPKALDGVPIFVFIHGGYWEEGSRSFYRGLAKPYLDQNAIVAFIGYDLSSDSHKIPDTEQQCVKALTFLTDKYPKSRVVLSGHSAGAYLATAMLSYQQLVPRFHALVLLCGVYELSDLMNTHIRKAIDVSRLDEQNLLCRQFGKPSINRNDDVDADKKNDQKNKQNLIGNSKDARDTKCKLPKILMYIGESESPIFHCQSIRMFEKLSRDGFNVTFNALKGEDHFSLIEEMLDQGSVITQSIFELLW